MPDVMFSQKEKATLGHSSFCLAFGNYGLPGIKGYFKPLTPLGTYSKLWKHRFMSFGFVSWIMEAPDQRQPSLLGG